MFHSRSFRRRAAVAAVLLLVACPAWSAGTPVVDTKSIFQQIEEAYQKAKHWYEEQEWIKAGRKLRAKLTENEVHAEMRAASALAVRQHWGEAARRRAEVMERSRSDRDVCRNVQVSLELGEAEHAQYREVVAPVRASFEERSAAVLTQPAGTQRRHVMTKALEVLDRCQGAESDGGGGEGDASACVDAHGLLTGGQEGALSEDDVETAKQQIDLLIDPMPRTVMPAEEVVRPADVALSVRERRRLAILSLASASLSEVLANYASVRTGGGDDGYTSRISALRKFAHHRFGAAANGGDPKEATEFQRLVANADTDMKKDGDDVMPAEVQRMQAAMDAYQTRLALLQYEQSLRMEALTATALALQANPL